jgi:hypothetical protein
MLSVPLHLSPLHLSRPAHEHRRLLPGFHFPAFLGEAIAHGHINPTRKFDYSSRTGLIFAPFETAPLSSRSTFDYLQPTYTKG